VQSKLSQVCKVSSCSQVCKVSSCSLVCKVSSCSLYRIKSDSALCVYCKPLARSNVVLVSYVKLRSSTNHIIIFFSILNAFSACLVPGFPRGLEKVLNYEVSFQDLEKVLYLAKMYIKYGNSKFTHLSIQILFFTADDSFANLVCIVFHE